MTQHTPGPWKAISPVEGERKYWSIFRCNSQHQVMVLRTSNRWSPPNEEADARLIAAAPEMEAEIAQLRQDKAELLSAIGTARVDIQTAMDKYFTCKNSLNLCNAFKILEAAIAKATQ